MKKINLAKVILALILAQTPFACKQATYGVNKPGIKAQPVVTPASNDQIANNKNGVTFGTTGVFHLGDASFNASTCHPQLAALPVSGRRLNFTFAVSANNTPVNIAITELCGVDLDNNMISINSDTSSMPPMAIPVNASGMELPQVILNAGTYTVSVISGRNINNQRFTRGNYDDFIVGHVQINGPNIMGIEYGAQLQNTGF